jgi:hypothetical protein
MGKQTRGSRGFSSSYLLLVMHTRVRNFAEEAEGMCVSGSGGGGMIEEEEEEEEGEGDSTRGALRRSLDVFTREVLLPRINKDYMERMRELMSGAEVWTKVASSSTKDGGAQVPVLETAVAADGMMQELLAVSAALPAHASEIGKLWDSMLLELSKCATGAVTAITHGSRVHAILTAPPHHAAAAAPAAKTAKGAAKAGHHDDKNASDLVRLGI